MNFRIRNKLIHLLLKSNQSRKNKNLFNFFLLCWPVIFIIIFLAINDSVIDINDINISISLPPI